ncbi:hypothetical protein D3C81_1708600 [compost metagenome]
MINSTIKAITATSEPSTKRSPPSHSSLESAMVITAPIATSSGKVANPIPVPVAAALINTNSPQARA